MLCMALSRRIPALQITMSRRSHLSIAADYLLALVVVGDRPVVGDRFAAGRLDLVDHLACGRRILAVPGRVTAEVVDDHLRAFGGKAPRDLATDAAPGAGHDGNLFAQNTHGGVSRLMASRS